MERMMAHRADTRIDVDEQPDGWYVVRVEDGDDTDRIAGPFDTEQTAERVKGFLIPGGVHMDRVDRIDGYVKAHSTGDWA
jgi:hypothetical protein